MRRYLISSLLAVSLTGLPCFVGCERELSHEKKVESTPSGTTVKEKKTVENPDGSITKTPAPETLHPFIDMDRPQFGEHNAADQWNHVRLDVIAVVLPGSERNAALSLVEL